MIIIKSTKELNHWFNENVNTGYSDVGFVPTMGALHLGHSSLIERATKESRVVVVSILVNPTQFNENSDLLEYPRTLDKDIVIARDAGCNVLFTPTAEDIYEGAPSAEHVDYGDITNSFEGVSRKGHFDGVVAVVDKLFQAVNPDKAYLGSKDLQQVAVVERMSKERHPKVEIVSCDLIRDEKGLALSSRNRRLSDMGIVIAQRISYELREAVRRISVGSNLVESVESAKHNLSNLKGLELEYMSGVDCKVFSEMSKSEVWTHIIVAAKVEGVRLIDNIEL